jgi:hypothetical protein
VNHGSKITTPETGIPESADVERCPKYPLFSPFGFACKKIPDFVVDRFSGRSWLAVNCSRVKPGRLAERACQEATAADWSAARNILHRRSDPYNPPAPLHAQSMADAKSRPALSAALNQTVQQEKHHLVKLVINLELVILQQMPHTVQRNFLAKAIWNVELPKYLLQLFLVPFVWRRIGW